MLLMIPRQRKLILVILVLFVIFYMYLTKIPYLANETLDYDTSIDCFRYNEKPTLPDISTVKVRPGKSIFFHETSCNSYKYNKLEINHRQACSVESAALMNPNLDVYLTFSSPGVFKYEKSKSDRLLKALMSYPNVRINHLNYTKYTEGTPVEEFYSNGTIEGSKYPSEHAGDILRFLTLWKYGGIYLDLNVIVLKSLETLPSNFAGCETYKYNLGAGILGFGPDEDGGHTLANEALIDLMKNFDGNIWGYYGSPAITRLAKKHCQLRKHNTSYICNKTCDNFSIFPANTFYAVPWIFWWHFFQDDYRKVVMAATMKSYIIHVWNAFSLSTNILVEPMSAYAALAAKHCPKVWDTHF